MTRPTDDHIHAWHEAAHAVIAFGLGGTIVQLSIESEEAGYRASASIAWTSMDSKGLATVSAMTALGGPLAEILRFGAGDPVCESDLAAWAADWDEVLRAAELVAASGEERKPTIDRWIHEVHAMLQLDEVEERIARVADALEAHGTLDATLFESCLA